MKIVIVGAGTVGRHLAKTLSWREHEVSVIDHNPDLVDRARNTLDVLAIRGQGTSIRTLMDAGVESADLLIAVTSVDEVNIVACMLAQQMGAKKRIARVRSQEYSKPNIPVKLSDVGIDQIIHPELEAAHEVVKMIRYQNAIDVVECSGGRMMLVGLNVQDHSQVIGTKLKDVTPQFPNISVRVVALLRRGKTIIPSGDDSIMPGDLIYTMCPANQLNQLFEILGKSNENSNDIMLLGGGLVGRLVAHELEQDKKLNIKLIESDIKRSEIAAQELNNTMVVRGGEELDIDMMAIEGIEDMGVFAALSDDNENNIVTSLFARHLRVKRTITLIKKPEYMAIARSIGLDAAVNELILTSDAILKHLIGQKIMAVSTLRGINADIVEFSVGQNAKVVGKRLMDLKFPRQSLVGAIEHDGDVSVAVGSSVIHGGDRVVVFSMTEAVPKLDKMFA